MSEDKPELVDGIPVLASEPRVVAPARSHGMLSPLVVQSAAVAATSMVAGATAVALVRRGRGRRARRNAKVLAPVLASRSFLIDVHLLGERK